MPMRVPPYALLAIAIVAEVIATSALRASEGFSRVLPPSWSWPVMASRSIVFR